MKVEKILGLVIFLAFLIVGLFSLPQYGPNWDEPVHFGRGQAILYYFLSGNKNYQDLPETFGSERSFYQSDGYTYAYFEQNFLEKTGTGELMIGGGHPPLSDTLAAFFNFIFYQKIGFLGDVEAYHFYGLFLASILVAVVYYFGAKNYGWFAGLIAAVCLALYPLFLGESRFNIKDVPETVFFSLTILLFYQGVVSGKIRWLWLSALFFAFALGTKLNIIFIPFIFLPWLAFFFFPEFRKEGLIRLLRKRKKVFFSFLLYPFLGILIFFLSWPLLWPNPVGYFGDVLGFYRGIGTNPSFDPRFLTFFKINTYALQWVIYTTPLIVLFFGLWGLVVVLKNGLKEKNKTSLLILFWFLIPIVRVTLPGAGIYGGTRQIMEYIPAMALLAGVGAARGLEFTRAWLEKKFGVKNKALASGLIILTFLPISLRMISLHPNENLYFNFLVGGLEGAEEKDLPGWGNSLGSTYRQGVTWLNQNAKPKAKVALVYELKSNIPRIDFRPDIVYDNHVRSAIKREGEYLIGVTHQGTAENSYHRKYLERFLNPVYELKIDQVAVLKIWKNDLEHTKMEYQGGEESVKDFSLERGEKSLVIDLKETLKITRLEIDYPFIGCDSPNNGGFLISEDGRVWESLPGNLRLFPLASWFTPMPKEGKLQFLFAADEARFIKLTTTNQATCLLEKPIKVSLWQLPTQAE